MCVEQLQRTTADLVRLIPFSLFVVVPFLEFTLPFFLYFFPNMLPSTFSYPDKEAAKKTQRLKLRVEVAKFLQVLHSFTYC